MRIVRAAPMAVLILLLTGCAAAPLLPSQSQLMWALLRPLVGFDPNQVNLFEQPLVKQRMTALLGSRYDPAMRLLRTANELKQEGPLLFVVSRFTPIPELAENAGLVWNSQTNQMAAILRKGEVAEVFTEAVATAVRDGADDAVHEAGPVWPAVMKPWLTPPSPQPL